MRLAAAVRRDGRRAWASAQCLIVIGSLRALALVGCQAGATAPVGISPPRSPERPVVEARAATAEASPVEPDFRSHMTRLGGPFLSRGHGERFDAIVWSNEAARQALVGGGDGADGALLVEEAVVHDIRGDEAAGLLVMERRNGWRFVAIAPDGTVVSDRRVADCPVCHAEAPHSVFPLP